MLDQLGKENMIDPILYNIVMRPRGSIRFCINPIDIFDKSS